MRVFAIIVVLFTYSFGINAQEFAITFPTYQAVFQRDLNNNGFIPITGNYAGQVDRVEGRLIPVRTRQGTETDWQLIHDKPDAGFYLGKVSGRGGWYQLDVRFLYRGIVQRTLTLARVGIGEVFLIGGQSNAQGLGVQALSAKPAQDERVVSVNEVNETDNFDNFQIKPFAKTNVGETIAPGGGGPWCWGELGDYIAARYNVPVAFFNGAWGGMEYFKWIESINGKQVSNAFGPLPAGQPYANMRYMGQFYGSLYGFRAMLWMQGEGRISDLPAGYNSTVYSDAIQQLFDKFRSDLGKKIGIVIARTSLTITPGSTIETIAAQELLINKVGNNIFRGPFTDTIQAKRPDGTHFFNLPGNAGISALARGWNESLDDKFFQQCQPFQPANIAPIPQTRCRDGFNPTSTVSSDYTYQRWSNGSKAKELALPNDYNSLILRDRTGNTFITPRMLPRDFRPLTRPQINVVGKLTICENETTSLTAVGDFVAYRWNSNDTTKVFNPKRSGEYAVYGLNQYGCYSLESNSVGVTVLPVPAKPTIITSGPVNFCQGGQVTLTAPFGLNKYSWSSGANTQSITVRQSGNYSISVTDQNGCASANSNPTTVRLFEIPPKPTVSQIGTYTIGSQITGNLDPSDTFTWLNDKTELPNKGSVLKTTTPGSYSSQLNRVYTVGNQRTTCRSEVSAPYKINELADLFFPKKFSLYPNPTKEGYIYIEAKENLRDVIITVYNQVGQLVHTQGIPDLTMPQKINVSRLSSGSYIIKAFSNGVEFTNRIIIE